MPSIFDVLRDDEGQEENDGKVAASVQYDANQGATTPTSQEEVTEPPAEEEKSFDISGNLSADEQEQQSNESMAIAEESAPLSTQLNQPKFEDPNSWSAEVTQRSFAAEAGNSMMRGLGNYVIKGTGDLFQVAGAVLMPGMDMDKGNVISRLLQDSGGKMADKYATFIPEELKSENFTYSSMLNSKFWSQNVAEAIPQLAEFIFLSKGGSAIAKKTAGSLAKKGVEKGLIKGAKATARGKEVFGTGKGLAGKLITDQGLTSLGGDIVGAVGGGLTSNMLSGMLNAADVYNSNKGLKDKEGNPLYTKEQLEDMAAATFTNNAKYLAVDMLSWGMTFGGGYKQLGKLGTKAKGSMWNAAQQSKVMGKFFTGHTKPMFKSLAKLSGKAVTEGFEETIQESWEEWSKMKAIESVTGKPAKYKNFMEFYQSPENKMTKAVSFALGGLGGGAFNMVDAINKSADENARLYNRIENLKNITNKMGTEQENTWQEYHIRQQAAELVIENKIDAYNEFADELVNNGNITEDERAGLDEMVQAFQQADAQASKLNIKGRDALLKNVATEKFFESKIEELQNNAQENIATVQGMDLLSDEQKATKVAQIEGTLAKQVEALGVSLAQAKQNQANLIMGKLATPIDLEVSTDENGNEFITGGLSKQQFQEFTKEGEEQKANEPTESPFEKLKRSKLSEVGKGFVDKIVEAVTGVKKSEGETKEDGVDDDSPKTVEDVVVPKKAKTLKEMLAELKANPEIQENLPKDFLDLDEEQQLKTYNEYVEQQVQASKEQASSQEDVEQAPEGTEEQEGAKGREDATTTGESEKGKIADSVNKIVEDIKAGKITAKEARKLFKALDNPTDENLQDVERAILDARLEKDKTLSQEQKEFVKKESEIKDEGESIEAERKRKREQAIKNFKIGKSKKGSADVGMDKRAKKSVFSINKAAKAFKDTFVKVLQGAIPGINKENISQNDVDNYLNSAMTGALYAPSEIDKMVAVNHQMKRMFGKKAPSVFIVKNLFESIGSKGLGHTLASTVFIDEKSWDQNNVFMHEMSHVYYKLTQNQPSTQKMMDEALKNTELLKSVKKAYDDYTLYETDDGQKRTKGQILQYLLESGGTKDDLGKFIDVMVRSGRLKNLPLSEQAYIKEEVFAASLEGPLSKRFDKHFHPKNELTRQRVASRWWKSLKDNGKKFEEDGTFDMLLNKLADGKLPKGDRQAYMQSVWKEASEGIQMDSFGMDKRAFENEANYTEAINDISERKAYQTERFDVKNLDSVINEDDRFDALQNGIEEDGVSFFDKSFDSKVKGASAVLQDFGKAYQKALRTKFLKDSKGKVVDKRRHPVYNRDLFEATIYDLASEVNKANDFIYAIENSPLREIRAFNRYLNVVKPENKLVLLNSMYFVLSNRSVVNGIKNTINKDGVHKVEASLSQREMNMTEGIMSRLNKDRKENSVRYSNFQESFKQIARGKGVESDYTDILNYLTNSSFNMEKVLERGYITYQGTNYPIDMLINAFAKAGKPFNQGNPDSGIYIYNLRPIIQSLIATNREFTPLSTVKNAEGNMEPVRIVNNHLTKELGSMNEFLATKPTKEEFVDRYSHVGSKGKADLGKRYVPNKLLESIYDNYQSGILPSLSQYHGVEDISNDKGNLYKNSSDIEQTIEDLLMFRNTAFTEKGKAKKTYLGNMGTFSDSPRKFFLNVPKINFDDVFITNDKGRIQFKGDGVVVNSMFNLHNNIKADGITKVNFRNQLKKTIQDFNNIVKENATELAKIKSMQPYFTNGKLNRAGSKFVAEYVINSIANGYNVADIFAPNINHKDIVKRFKLNTSPIMSVKNPNFKIETLPFADEVLNGSKAGTDSAMYILKEDALKWQQMGKGVFDMNGGFKFLNASIEKSNPNFKGKTAYLKGYTTIVEDGHPLYKAMKERKDKYNKLNGVPSNDLTDGTHNHMVIAMSMSSDKSNFFEGIDKTKFTPDAIAQDTTAVNEWLDKNMYDGDNFLGIESYNFGPQQLMDKKTTTSNLPVQLVNSIMVNAAINDNLDLAVEIQEHLAKQQRDNLQKYLDQVKKGSHEEYRNLIMEGLNKKGMDQAQRILLDDNGSLSHPYVNEIIVNQLVKTIRRKGNKLETAGSYSHQKPDIGYNIPQELRSSGERSSRLSGYKSNTDGTLQPMEAVLPAHLTEKYEPRKAYTFDTHTIRDRKDAEGLAALKSLATKKAKRRARLEGYPEADYPNYMGESRDANGDLQGYWVKGESVLMSRVPGHGPASTGVFEVMGFDTGEGNQVMVPSEFNDIIGSDNDGDALFIQTRDRSQKEYNEAFTKIKKLWLSKGMNEQIQTQMDFEDNTQTIVNDIKSVLGTDGDKGYVFPFSPMERMNDYNNTMVSKRLVGTVFNLHKIANLLATYKTSTNRAIQVGGAKYDSFNDTVNGNESRNQKSAILANIILDNAKWGFADDLGLNEFTTAQAVLMTNMGIPLKDIGMILNSDIAKEYSRLNKNNNSMFHEGKSQSEIIKKLYTDNSIKRNPNVSLKIDTTNINSNNNKAPIIELLSYLSDMNSDVQKLSAIMSGHNKIHVNPFVLEKQINDAKELIAGAEATIDINEDLKSNPELQRYLDVAEETLFQLKRVNPVFRGSTEKVLNRLNSKVSDSLSNKQIENFSRDVSLFTTSRLLGHNNVDIEYAAELINPNSKNSIFNKLDTYLNTGDGALRNQLLETDGENMFNSVSGEDNSYLFRKALNISLEGNDKYISANPSFVNDSLSDAERKRVQQEFQELPDTLRDDLILYDLIQRGWKGPLSLAPFFGETTNAVINMTANQDFDNKNQAISENVLREVEKIVALKKSLDSKNPFNKVYLKKGAKATDLNAIMGEIRKNKSLKSKLSKGKPFYINVRRGKNSELFEFQGFEKSDIVNLKKIDQSKGRTAASAAAVELAKNRLMHIPNNLIGNGNVNLATISDNNTGSTWKSYQEFGRDNGLDSLVEASINYEDVLNKLKGGEINQQGFDAREDYDSALFEAETPLSFNAFAKANEYEAGVSDRAKKKAYDTYLSNKKKANELANDINYDTVKDYEVDELLEMYKHYGNEDAYAYSIVMTPIIKELAQRIATEQSTITGRIEGNDDISPMKAYMMTGSTIPSDHPASQAVARIMEREYKNFLGERSKLMREKEEITDALYRDKLGYGVKSETFAGRIANVIRRTTTSLFQNRQRVYDRLYGNLVISEDVKGSQGKIVKEYRLRPRKDVETDFNNGFISKAEMDFYNFFRETTDKLKPKDLKNSKEDYIPHTAMSKLEAFSSRGLLGLLTNSKKDEQRAYDVVMDYNGEKMSFKEIEDIFKAESAGQGKNSILKSAQYMKLKHKAEKLAKQGKNEDGTPIRFAPAEIETVLGFGAVNRFANNRSVKATEMPSMDLDRALSDYIHSTIFVNGYGKFAGMEKLQGFIDGVLAHNRANKKDNMNKHIQLVWKDYFAKGMKQDSALGKRGDKVVRALTKLNVSYGLGYKGLFVGKGLYAVNNAVVGKYNNIKDIGAKRWVKAELKFWGLDSLEGGPRGIMKRHKRMMRILKNINYMDNNVYDDISVEKRSGLDGVFTDIMLAPMIASENWIQKVHSIGYLDDAGFLDRFDENGNYKEDAIQIDQEELIMIEDKVKSQHGRGYSMTDQRAIQMYSWGNMVMQYSKFIPTMMHDRFAKRDVNIYGQEHIGSLRSAGELVRHVINNPNGYTEYYNGLSDEEKLRLKSAMRGLSMSAVIAMIAGAGSSTANEAYWDANYYFNYDKLKYKLVPSAIQTTNNLVSKMF